MAEPTIGVDHHHHGLYALSPIALFCAFLVCAAAFGIFSLLQITGTEQAVFDLLQLGVSIKPGMTSDQVAQLWSGALDHNHTVAGGIGWSVQIALFLISLSPEQALAVMHRKYNTVVSSSLAQHAEFIAKVRKGLTWILIGGDLVTDFFYAVEGHLGWDGWHPSLSGSAGVLIVGLMYPVGVVFVTFFAGKYLFAYLDALFAVLKSAKSASKSAAK